VIRKAMRWADRRLGVSHFTRAALDKIFPDHWSFMLGEVAMYCLVILILTGVYLTFFFVPASKEVMYHGEYAPLNGVEMSAAYASTLDLSFKIRSGLVMRQMHHWAALILDRKSVV
jgi:ubiquinol-cytochrome c reductase cytochrome b subunit